VWRLQVTHLSDKTLLEILAGRIGFAEDPASGAHLAECSTCTRRLSDSQATWSVLGEWTLERPTPDLRDSIESAIDADATQGTRVLQPRSRWMGLTRIAASIVLSVGLGHAAGRLFRPAPSDMPCAMTAVTPDDVVELLSLDVLARSSPVGLIDVVEDAQVPESMGG
jgi:hypothetical protein